MPLGAFNINAIAKRLVAAVVATTWNEPFKIRYTAQYNTGIRTQTTNLIKDINYADNGNKMYILDESDVIYQYSCSTAYDPTTASYDSKSFSMTAEGDIKEGFHLVDSGSKLFVTDRTGDEVRRYTLSSPLDISTASFDSGQTLDVSGKDTQPYCVRVEENGSSLFMIGNQNNTIHKYDLSSAYDLTSASFSQTGSTVNEGQPNTFNFNGDGTQLWVSSGDDNSINEYDLSTGYDLSTLSAGDNKFFRSTYSGDTMFISPDGSIISIVANYFQGRFSDGALIVKARGNQDTLTFNSDSDASNLSLAVPFAYDQTGFHDVSAHINSSVTGSITINGGHPDSRATMTNSQNKFGSYGGSYEGNQTGTVSDPRTLNYKLDDNGRTAFPSATSGGNSYTLECYVRATSSVSNNNWCFSSGDVGGRWLWSFNTGGTVSIGGGEKNIGLGDSNWHHIAIVLDAGTRKFYIDGDYQGTWTSGNTGFTTLHVGGFNTTDTNSFRGNLQDLRVYINTAKYTGTSGSGDYTPPGSIVSAF